MKVLIVDDDNSIIELLAIILENSISPKHIGRALNPQSAKEELSQCDYNLVICDFEMYPYGTGQDVFDYIKDNNLSCKFLLFSGREFESTKFSGISEFGPHKFHYLKKPAQPKVIREAIAKLIQSHDDIKDYYGIRIHNFIRFESTKCNIYIKLGLDKYVKILNKDDSYDNQFLQKYIIKEVSHFYITKNDYNDFLVEFGRSNFLVSNASQKTFLDTAMKSHLYLTSLVSNVGISDFVLEEANQLAIKSLEMSQRDKTLSKLIETLINSQNYSYDHTFLITCFCTQIGLEIGLNKIALEKLAFASLVHDLGISRDNLCVIHDLFPEKIEKLELEEQFIIKNHHSILDKFKHSNDLTDDIEKILKIHHTFDKEYIYNEIVTGLDKVSHFVGVFLISHMLSNEFYKNDFDSSKLADSLTNIKHTFQGPNFDKILRALDIIIYRKKIF